MSSKGYIWDEWSDDEDNAHRHPIPSSRSLIPTAPRDKIDKSSASSASSTLKLDSKYLPSSAPAPRPPISTRTRDSSSTLPDPPLPNYSSLIRSHDGDEPLSPLSMHSGRASRVAAANLEKELEIYDNDELSSIGFESLVQHRALSGRDRAAIEKEQRDERSLRQPSSSLTSPGSVSFGGHKTKSDGSRQNFSSSTMTSVVDELKLKIQKIQSNIQDIATKNKTLKTELIRLQTSKERKMSKLASSYESKLQQLDKEHQTSMQQLSTFQQKLMSDIKTLKQKHVELMRKHDELQTKRSTMLPALQQDQQRKKQKFIKSLETEEANFFDKQFQAKYEQQYKERQNLEFFTPKLQEWMTSNKEQIAQKVQEYQHQLESKRLSLQQSQASQLSEFKQQLLIDKDRELEKLSQQEERMFREFVEKHDKELAYLQESYYENERKKILSNYELTQQNEFSFHQKTLETILSKENSLLSEMIAQQKQEINNVISEKNNVLHSYLSELQQEKENYLNSLSQQHEQQELSLFEQVQRKIVNYFALSTQEIMMKLAAEYSKKREDVQQQYDKEIEQYRQKSEKKLQQLKENEEKSLSRMVSLKAEVETLEDELNQMRSNPLYYPNKMQEQKKKLSGLREELHSMEQKFDALDNTFREERKQEEHRLSAELARIKAAEEEKRIQKSQAKAEKERHENEIDEEYRDELDRIEQKIALVLQKKDKMIDQYLSELQELQQLNQRSEERLEELRQLAYS